MNGITSRLQAGTTPGNPDPVNQWNSAQGRLDAVVMGVGTLNSLATQGDDRGVGRGLPARECAGNLRVGGAVEEDHRNLRSIESEATRSMQQIDRLISDLNAEIARQNGFITHERTNLAALSYGVNVGRLGSPGMQRVTVTPRGVVSVQPSYGAPAMLGSPFQ